MFYIFLPNPLQNVHLNKTETMLMAVENIFTVFYAELCICEYNVKFAGPNLSFLVLMTCILRLMKVAF